MPKGFTSSIRITLITVCTFTCFIGVMVRLVFLHVIDRDRFLKYIEISRREIVVEHAPRGAIFDSNGGLLATNCSYVTIGADPEVLCEKDEAYWPELAHLLKIPPLELKRKLSKDIAASKLALANAKKNTGKSNRIRWVKLRDMVNELAYSKIDALKIHGVYGIRKYKRVYPKHDFASQVLGYINKNNTNPVMGIERYLDFFLQGKDGWIESEKNGANYEMTQFRSQKVPMRSGYDVVLTIDSSVQQIAENELKEIGAKYSPNFATIIISEPQTGYILAMANYPTFDLNNFQKTEQRIQRNYSVSNMIEPGSTFKIVSSSAALDLGFVTPQTIFDCGITNINYKGRKLRLPKEAHPLKKLSVSSILSRSSNRGAAQLAMLIGEQNFYNYIRLYGFGQKTNCQVCNEMYGLLKSPKDWDPLSITRMPMGHAIAATPLQIHMAMGVVANDGVLLWPQIIKEIRDSSGNVVFRFAPRARKRVLKSSTAATLMQLLRNAVANGTGKKSDIPGFGLAGKTGTTQKIVNKKYVNNRQVVLFSGFFPTDQPSALISVIIDDPQTKSGNAYASSTSAPAFKDISEQLIQCFKVNPTEDTVKPAIFAAESFHL